MGLLVSDYDGTFLTTNKIDLIINCRTIEKYIMDGNYFLLSSGRPYDSIMKQIKKHNIPYTHLAASDGTFLFDSQNNLLKAGRINKEILEIIDPLVKKNIHEKIQFSYSRFDTDIYIEKENLGSLALVVKENKIDKDFLKLYDQIKANYLNYQLDIYGHNGTYYFEIREKGINKSSPIEYLRKLLEINKKKIYTIGDNDNDLEMIRDYNGFMIGNNEKLEEVALGKYNAVHELIYDIQKKKVLKRW